MVSDNLHQTAPPEYSETLVAFVRALDSAEMAVITGLWHFVDLEMYSPETMTDPEDVPSWARHNLETFGDHLPALRAVFRAMVMAESNGIAIEGDACPLAFLEAAFKPIKENCIQYRPSTISPLASLPAGLKAQIGSQRVVYWDGEVYVIPDAFVDVWFHRADGYWEDGGVCPVRLERREYGWQAFGIER